MAVKRIVKGTALYCMQLVGVIIAVVVVAFFGRLLLNPFLNIFVELWHGDITIRSMIFMSATILSISGIVALVYKLNGSKVIENPPNDDTWNFLAECLFEELITLSAPLGFIPPSHKTEITPSGSKHYIQGTTGIYVFWVLKSKSQIDIDRVLRLIKDRLKRNQTLERMNCLGGRIYGDIFYGSVIVIDVKDYGDYVRIELALTSEEAIRIARRRLDARRANKASGVTASFTDKEF
jgi:hypothetical protein